jgi:hypothetical protein
MLHGVQIIEMAFRGLDHVRAGEHRRAHTERTRHRKRRTLRERLHGLVRATA